MTERGILMSAPMVLATLAGTKTQTRRIAKPGRSADVVLATGGRPFTCPYGKPGDRLWVRETWAGPLVDQDVTERDGFAWRDYQKPEFCRYAADGGPRPEFMDADDNLRQRWTPGIHMFRWASRITLEVVSVRVERLQDISRGDAMDEGCPFPNMAKGPDPRRWYADLWVQINGPGSWDANPWVWCVEFRPTNADAALQSGSRGEERITPDPSTGAQPSQGVK